MRYPIKSLMISFLAILLVVPIIGANGTASPGIIEMQIYLSKTEIYRGESIIINITLIGNFTSGLNDVNITQKISHKDTGIIVDEKEWHIQMSEPVYIINNVYTSNSTCNFGTYYVWVIVENMSSFGSFNIVPTSLDLYYQGQEIQKKQAEQDMTIGLLVIRDILIIIASVLVLITCYVFFRLPDSSKKDLKNWWLSWFDTRILKKLFGEFRDFDRKRQRRYEFPTMMEKEMEQVRYKKIVHYANQLLQSWMRKQERKKAELKRLEEGIKNMIELRDAAKKEDEKLEAEIAGEINGLRERALKNRDMMKGSGWP